MANISSFYGTGELLIDDKPWTKEGVELFKTVMRSISLEKGRCYGIQITEFNDNLEELSFKFYGYGRWSALNNFDNFPSWTKHSTDEDLSDEDLLEARKQLIKLMYDNSWKISFDFKDEEDGEGFIAVGYSEVTAGNLDDGSLDFITNNDITERYDYTLYNYCFIFNENRKSDTFLDETDYLFDNFKEYLKSQNKDSNEKLSLENFRDFIINNDIDKNLPVSCYFDTFEEAMDYSDTIEKLFKDFLEECTK